MKQKKLEQVLQIQREAYFSDPIETYETRIQALIQLKRMILDNQDAICNAIELDFGCRPKEETQVAEILMVLAEIKATLKKLKYWMKPQRRTNNWLLFPGLKNRVIPQPLGVVGIIVPWNFPLNLSLLPLVSVFAAGNRAMIKMSENSMHLAQLLSKITPLYFPNDKLSMIIETGDVGPRFSALPFDHLIFTGSTDTGRKVMENAAKNLTPVTLELGGKCPAIITENFPLKKAVERILYVKQFNAGQICTSVDYVFVPQSHLERFVDMAKTIAPHLVPDITSVGYTSIINDQAYSRIVDTVAEAEAAGCRIVALSDQLSDAAIRKYPLTLIIDPPVRGLAIEEREIFGPLLLVRTYSDKQQVIKYIQPKPWPLAIYPFTKDISLADFYIDQLMSGGVTVNDALIHVAQHDLPFGGVGASGMGHYHGYEGFLTFSKLRPVSYQSRFSLVRLFYPPYSSSFRRLFRLLRRFFN